MKKFNDPFKYKCGHEVIMCVSIYINKCKMQFLSNDFNILKMNDSTLIIEKM